MTWAGLRAPLPRGVIDNRRVADARVRPLTGRDERFLAGVAEGTDGQASMAAVVTELLSRCVVELGDALPSVGDLRALSVGDREALLLHLRRATLGDQIYCVATCPHRSCGERLDLTLSVDGLLVEPSVDAVTWYEEAFASSSSRRDVDVRFRLPTGADQEAAAELAATDAEAAARVLLARCVSTVSGSSPAELPDDVADALGARMADLDPQAEIRLRFDCAACGRPVDVLFDTATFFLAEVAATVDRLDDEVHAIAWHYHWSEGDILDLPMARRRRYLDLIAASVGTRARGVA